MKKTLLVTVHHMGRIPPLYQDGPILNPIRIDINTAHTLVSCHYKVFEHNPDNISEKVQLNIQNLFSDLFEHKEEEKKSNETKKDEVKKDNKPIFDPGEEVIELESKNIDVSIPEKEDENVTSVEVANDTNEESNNQTMSIYEKAASLGINTEGMSKNRIKAAIREAQRQ